MQAIFTKVLLEKKILTQKKNQFKFLIQMGC